MKPPRKNPAWPKEVFRIYEHDIQEIWDSNIAPHIYNSYNEELRLYKGLAEQYAPRSILDVGCAQGTLALILGENGYKVYALDIRKNFLDYAKSRFERGNVEFICANILDAPFKIDSFDLIFANQIIEHVIDPLPLLKLLRTQLTLSGHLIMTTPNHAYFKNDLPSHSEIDNPGRYSKYHCSADGDKHFFAFTAEEIKMYCKTAGFTKVKVDYYATPWITGHCKIRHLHKVLPVWFLRWLNAVTLKITNIKAHLCYQLLAIAEV